MELVMNMLAMYVNYDLTPDMASTWFISWLTDMEQSFHWVIWKCLNVEDYYVSVAKELNYSLLQEAWLREIT